MRLHTICPYYTMFPVEFPLSALERATPGQWVLDPFCGRGTTTFAARLLGLPTVGIDSSPVAAAVAAAKLASATPDDVVDRAVELINDRVPGSTPTGKFWRSCYAPSTLRDICRLRDAFLEGVRTQTDVILRALVLGILHGPMNKGLPTYLSNQMPRTYATKPGPALGYWGRNALSRPPRVDVLDAISRRARFCLESLPAPTRGAVVQADARTTELAASMSTQFDWVVTSPPYFGMRTYVPDQWLRNWFLGGPPRVDYAQDAQLQHTEAEFVRELRTVWKNVAGVCARNATLVVRFGCLPCLPVDPEEMIRESLRGVGGRWRVTSVRDAGSASSGKRQSRQFSASASDPVREIDVTAKWRGWHV